jgi:hypothetical protein
VNSRLLELALEKQRLQFRSDALRDEWRNQARSLAPLFGAADQVRAGVRWLRRHPEVVVGAGVAVAVARPRAIWRWVRRGAIAWHFWRNGQRWLARQSVIPPYTRT